MSGSVTTSEGPAAIWLLFVRVMMTVFLLHFHSPIGQLMALWQASQIISPGAFPDPVLIQNAAVPMLLVAGAFLVTIGFKTRFMAIALLLILVGVSALELMSIDSLAGAREWFPRLSVIFCLLAAARFGAGRWSVDGLIAARLTARAAQ